jgi:polysaccharide pyruvyl transferase WcaK-like protein
VPTVALAYSLKTQGVFETCDMGEYVVDPRSLGTEEVVERLWQCWQRRDEARETLRGALEGTIRRAEEQIDRMLAILGLGSPALRHVSGPQSERVTG